MEQVVSDLRYELAISNRLGNRSLNQDRVGAAELGNTVVLILADGMGGHPRGELAAQVLIDSITRSIRRIPLPVASPENFLRQSLKIAHHEVVEAGLKETPPIHPRTTAVVCLIQDDHAWWAHLGDSRLYHLRGREIATRTRDHSYVEELMQKGKISQSEIDRHPMRNTVTQCIGGEQPPLVPELGGAQLEPGDLLLLCSDGLWGAIDDSIMTTNLDQESVDEAAESLASRAEAASYPYSDNISLITFRYLAPAEKGAPTKPPTPARMARERDTLDSAIDAIERALNEYGSEMGKPQK